MDYKEKVCPFRKVITSHDSLGYRVSMMNASTLFEKFKPCIGDKCMAFNGAGSDLRSVRAIKEETDNENP